MDVIKLNNDFNSLIDDYYEIWIYGKNDPLKLEHLEKISSVLKEMFVELYEFSKSNNFFWTFCSYRTYSNTYYKRLNEFLDKYDDVQLNENDFISIERKRLENKNLLSSSSFIPDSLLDIINKEANKKIDFLEKRLNIQIEKTENPFPFTNFKAKELFDQYFSQYKGDKSEFAHISFVYWTMINDKFIYEVCRPEMFKSILCEPPYGLDFKHLKSFKNLNQLKNRSRENYYYELKDSIMKSNI
ncbi:HAD family hydrolase [Flavobacterium oreochromis]|uniref:hypothetical protein n=1 Tax=Flavobacterium oreochromis TaxID=2906078 RepID=UPI00385CC827